VSESFQSRSLLADLVACWPTTTKSMHTDMRMDHDQVLETDSQTHMDVRSSLPG
jgi:hypothetical protein